LKKARILGIGLACEAFVSFRIPLQLAASIFSLRVESAEAPAYFRNSRYACFLKQKTASA